MTIPQSAKKSNEIISLRQKSYIPAFCGVKTAEIKKPKHRKNAPRCFGELRFGFECKHSVN